MRARAAPDGQDQSATRIGIRILRIHRNGAVEIGHGTIELLGGEQNGAARSVQGGYIVLERHRRVEIGERRSRLAFLHKCEAPNAESLGRLRIQRERLVGSRQRLVGLALLNELHRRGDKRRHRWIARTRWRAGHGRRGRTRRLGDLGLGGEREPLAFLGDLVVRRDRQNMVVIGDGPVEVSLGVEGVAAGAVIVRLVGRERDRAAIVRNGAVEVTRATEHIAATEARLRIDRARRDRAIVNPPWRGRGRRF